MRHRHKITLAAISAALLATATVAIAEPQRDASLSPGGDGFGWDGGPISGAAALAEVGAFVPCGPGKGCDDTLIRATGKGQLQVTTDSEDPNAVDFDLYLFESDESGEPGALIRSSTSGSSAESVSAIVEAGTYLARVVAATGAEGTYVGEARMAVFTEDNPNPDFGNPPTQPGDGSGGGGGQQPGGGGGQQQEPAPGTRRLPPATNAAPTSRAKRPGARSRRLTGTAADVDGEVAYVDVALARLRGDDRCRGLAPTGRFRRIRKCTAPPWVRARGREAWRVTLKRRLRPGRYVLYSRAIDDKGLGEGGYDSANRVAFRVRKRSS
ncbi:MAG TPA: hypothetical protein VF587_16845 [Solirubrobacteraceae bacterium]|jgi:hypothetical protein